MEQFRRGHCCSPGLPPNLPGPCPRVHQLQTTESLTCRLAVAEYTLASAACSCGVSQGAPRDRTDLSVSSLRTRELLWHWCGRKKLSEGTLAHSGVGTLICSCLPPLYLFCLSFLLFSSSFFFSFFPVVKDVLLLYSTTIIIIIIVLKENRKH